MLPLGIASISAYASRAGFKVTTFDLGQIPDCDEHLIDRYSDLTRFPVVGLSFYNVNAQNAFELARALRKRNKEQVIVAGGAHPTSCPKEVLSACPEIDIVVKGEGEHTFTEIMGRIVGGGRGVPLDGVAGAVWRSSDTFVDGGAGSRITDLDQLPPPLLNFQAAPTAPLTFYDRRDRRLRRAVAMTTSRSCPYNCSFCAIILIGREWRKASVEKVVADFVTLNAEYGPFEHVYFMDANFFVNAGRALAIAQGLSETKARPTFSFSTRVNQITRAAQKVRELVPLGLRAVELGVESASRSALERFAKDTTPEQNDAALSLLDDLGVQLIFDFIMFDAECTISELLTNVDFLERTGLDTYVPWDHLVSWLTPYHGTPIRAHYERELGLQLPVHRLPDPVALLLEPAVREVFVEMRRFSEIFPTLRRAVIATDRRIREIGVEGIDGARAALNSVSLKRLPFRVFRKLVLSAVQGQSIKLEHCIPDFVIDDGSAIGLRELLHELALS